MKSLTKKKINSIIEYILPAVLTILIFLLALLVKKVFPFGKEQFSIVDFNEQLVPFITNYWDILHGRANPFANWNVAAGGSVISSFFSDGYVSYFSPICLLVALFPRKSLLYSVVFLMLIKLALMATTSYVCFKKCFKNVNKIVLLLFSLTYTFSGWTLFHLSNICWYDILILLPLLVLAAKKLVEKGKIGWFVACFAYMIVINYYMAYMVAIGTIITATMYIIFIAKEKKKTACKFFAAMSFGVLIAFFALVPSALIALKANRFAADNILTRKDLYEPIFSKLMVIMMSALPFVFAVKLFVKFKKDNFAKFFLLSFGIMSVGIFIEPINLMWHTGSYFGYPLRYGYLIVLLLIFASLYYINKYLPNRAENSNLITKLAREKGAKPIGQNTTQIQNNFNVAPRKNTTKKFIVCAISVIFSIALAVLFMITISFGNRINPCFEVGFKYFVIVLAIFIICFALIWLAQNLKSKRLKLGGLCGGVLIFVLCLVQIVCNTVAFVGNSSGVTTYNRIINVYNLNVAELDGAYKLKDRDSLYNLDMGQLINFPNMSSFIAISSEREHKGYRKLGYNTGAHTLQSSGGTMLTDVLMGNKYILSIDELDERYYKKLDEFDYEYTEYYDKAEAEKTKKEFELLKTKVNLYELNLKMQPIFTTNVNLAEILKTDDYLENQNILFKAIYNTSENVLTNIEFSVQENKEFYTINLTAPADKIVYMSSNFEFGAEYNNFDRTFYEGLNDLGANNGEISIKIAKNGDVNLSQLKNELKFATFDVNLFFERHNNMQFNETSLAIDGSKLKINVSNTQNHKYAFVPYTNLYDMFATNNGHKTKVCAAFDGFMMVELEAGDNNITISYKPKYIKACLIISAVAIVAFVVFILLDKKFKFLNKKTIVWLGFAGACLVLLVVGFVVYLKPFVEFFIVLLK